jgi:hypothetical protein
MERVFAQVSTITNTAKFAKYERPSQMRCPRTQPTPFNNSNIDVNIQGVSKFDRQSSRVDSMIKNKHKTLNTNGVKNA